MCIIAEECIIHIMDPNQFAEIDVFFSKIVLIKKLFGAKRHGTVVVGAAALEKLAGPPTGVEFDTVQFRAQLARALAGEGDPPRLEFRAHV